MQQPAINWDLRGDVYIDGATKLYLAFLLLLVIWSLIATLRFWWLTSGNDYEAKLSNLWAALAGDDLEEVRTLSFGIATHLPEAGLSLWASLKAEDPKETYIQSFAAAHVNFQYRISQLQSISRSLMRLIVLTVIVTSGWFFRQASLSLRGIELSKLVAISALSGGLRDMASYVSVAAVLVALTYILRWWMVARLERRRRAWERFAGMLETITIPHGE